MSPFIFQTGETIVIAIDAMTGDPSSVTAITGKIKRVPRFSSPLAADEIDEADFIVTPRAAAGDVPAGWNLVTNTVLPPGSYLADARLVVGGSVIVTDAVNITIKQSASGVVAP